MTDRRDPSTPPPPEAASAPGRGLARAVVEDLKRRVLSGELATGDKLPSERELIERYTVSRTVIREALSRLAAAGIIETFHGRGSFVLATPQTPRFGLESTAIRTHADVVAMIEFRIGIETEAAALAASRTGRHPHVADPLLAALDAFPAPGRPGGVEADFGFHHGIATASGNRFYAELLASLGPMMIMLPRTRVDDRYSMTDPEHVARVRLEHENIAAAIVGADPEGARAAMRLHLSNSRRRLREG